MKPLLIIKTGSTMPDLAKNCGDFEDWILSSMQWPAENATIIDVRKDGPLPSGGKFCGAVITGSHDMVTEDHSWLLTTNEWLAHAAQTDLPILGICFGHQMLATALGGDAADNPNGLEYGTVEITLSAAAKDDPLFRDLPPIITGQVSHKQSAIQLPPGAVHLAASNKDPNQAFCYNGHVWGVQFHPEFDKEITRAYIRYATYGLRLRKQDPDALLQACEETPLAASLLIKFAEMIK